MILEVFSSLNNSDSTSRFLISVGIVRGPCSNGEALALTGKVKAFGTDLKKTNKVLFLVTQQLLADKEGG